MRRAATAAAGAIAVRQDKGEKCRGSRRGLASAGTSGACAVRGGRDGAASSKRLAEGLPSSRSRSPRQFQRVAKSTAAPRHTAPRNSSRLNDSRRLGSRLFAGGVAPLFAGGVALCIPMSRSKRCHRRPPPVVLAATSLISLLYIYFPTAQNGDHGGAHRASIRRCGGGRRWRRRRRSPRQHRAPPLVSHAAQ